MFVICYMNHSGLNAKYHTVNRTHGTEVESDKPLAQHKETISAQTFQNQFRR